MGLRREEQFEQDEDREAALSSFHPSRDDDDSAAYAISDSDVMDPEDYNALTSNPLVVSGKIAILITAIGWIGFSLWLFALRDFRMPGLEQIPLAFTSFCTPLILLGLAYLILSRGSVGEADRFGRITTRLRQEAEALDMRLAVVNQQLDAARHTMSEQAALLEQYGGSASLNLEAAARTMAQHASTSAQQAEIIERAGLALAHQFSQLVDAMPMVGEQANRASSALSESSDSLAEKVDRLEARLDSLGRLLDEARTRTTSTTQSLTAQLMRIQDATRSASEEVTGMADLSASRVDAAIEQASRAIAETGAAIDSRTLELNALVERSRSALESIGGEAVKSYGENISQIESRLQDLDRLILDQSTAISGIGEEMSHRIKQLVSEFQELETLGTDGSERITVTLDALSKRTRQLDDALQSGNRTAETLIAKAESLLVALDASVRELDEGHPAALARLNDKIDTSQRLLSVIMPEVEQIEAISSAVLGQARESEELLSGQGRKLKAWLDSGEASLAAYREQITELQRAMEAADSDARRLADSAGPQLVATLLRVKETADQAGDRARQALSRAIAEATDELGDTAEQALTDRLGEQFRSRIEELSMIADRAVNAAHMASERLMRQLITIADTTASIEQRFSEADEAAQRREQDNFSKRSALLIDSLNSIAIDVAKILSEEVSDSSWAAYLEGDRGVFSRKAVRLIDGDEAGSILSLYESNDSFRDSVNRYVHDFEAMLRTVLTTREGTSLAVTLLSSDIGKLYVALAQAIDRLKNS